MYSEQQLAYNNNTLLLKISSVLMTQVQVVLLLGLHDVVHLVPVVWTCLVEDTASVIESVLPMLTTIAALTIPVTVKGKHLATGPKAMNC